MTNITRRQWLWIILLAYLLLGVSYALATPPLEASDEYKHYPVVQYVQREGRLPVLDPQDPGRWLQEGAQPPLYYALMAGLTSWIDSGDLAQLHDVNRHAFIGDPNQLGNKNLILHNPQREAFPWQGSVLAIYVIRFATLLLGAGAIVLTERIGRLVFSDTIGLLAAALTAFNPMFLFVSAAVNNDALSILLGHAALFVMLTLWRRPPHPTRGWRRFAGLGLLLGLGLLTKLSLGGLLALTALLLAWLAKTRNDARYLLLSGSLVALVALVVAAPWLWRNWQLYGDPTAMNVFIAVQGTRDTAITWADWRAEFGTFYRSFWGLFGGVNVAAPQLFYTAYNLLALAGFAGFGYWLWRRRKEERAGRPLWLLLVGWTILLFILLIRWNIISPAFQGRLIFPALGAINVVLAQGLLQWAPLRRRGALAGVVAGATFLVAAVLPWSTIRPAYAFPQPLQAAPAAHAIEPIRFHAPQGAIDLVGAHVPPDQSVVPGGEPVTVILYWRAVDPVERNYLSSIHLLGRGLDSVSSIDRHPAKGMIPTSRWQAGQIWRDDYHLYVRDDARAPARLQVRVGLYDPQSDSDLPMTDSSGATLELLLVGDARLGPDPDAEPPSPPIAREVQLEDGVRLLGYSLPTQAVRAGEPLEIVLFWQATGQPAQDYTVFVHLLEEREAQPLTTADGPPVSGFYPTSFWRAGDVVDDAHTLDVPVALPPGEYLIGIGLYDPASGRRLARSDGGDTIFIEIVVE